MDIRDREGNRDNQWTMGNSKAPSYEYKIFSMFKAGARDMGYNCLRVLSKHMAYTLMVDPRG
jgi:hypothetical protein